jgi:hypothetical protein
MTTWQVLRRLTRRKHIFSTDRTIVFVLVLEALVGIKDADGNTHTTLIAMTEGINTAYTAKSTLSAMKRFLGLSHKTSEMNHEMRWCNARLQVLKT